MSRSASWSTSARLSSPSEPDRARGPARRSRRAGEATEPAKQETAGAARRSATSIPRYVFDRFVTGPNNEYATAVAHSVAESPATAYNPVFIYAGTGLGKTHLTQAIAHAALEQHPELNVRYVTCERFTDDFINAVTDKGRIEGFKQTYRDNDVLIVDDVQFLADKQQTQVEFFHTFNALYEAGKQIVITSDRPPRELEELEDRLRSRFGQGVVVDISRPDLETRIAILRKQVKWEGYQIAEPEALEWIAQKVTSNIRELYGALTRAVSFASIRGSDVTLEITREALKDIVPRVYEHPVTIEMVQNEVARQFGLHVNDLRGNRRTQDVAYAAAHRDVPLPGAHGGLSPADRRQVRRAAPHHGHARRRQGGAATQGRPRHATPGPRGPHHRARQVLALMLAGPLGGRSGAGRPTARRASRRTD